MTITDAAIWHDYITKHVKKNYRITPQIGKAKHAVSFHDGVKTHQDGSPFYDLIICKNKRNLAKFVASLRKQGYVEQGFSLQSPL